MKQINYDVIQTKVLDFLDAQDNDTFRCPSQEEIVKWFDGLSDREKTICVSLMQLPNEGWEIPENFTESSLVTH